jgi:hypothetical protein
VLWIKTWLHGRGVLRESRAGVQRDGDSRSSSLQRAGLRLRSVEMMNRVVVPELLDSMSHDDPEAIRSRRDLRRINLLMGNERWICRAVSKFPEIANRGIVEIGAGDGGLCNRLQKQFPTAPVAAYDLAPAPKDLNAKIKWHQGDIFTMSPPTTGGVLIANLFLHHFEGETLLELGRWVSGFDILIFNEPDRASFPHLLGKLMHPFINRVTRHDMHVSIRAGFTTGEMIHLMRLERQSLNAKEICTWRGARRVIF